MSKIITLVSDDGSRFDVSIASAKLVELVTNTFEGNFDVVDGVEVLNGESELDCPRADSKTLKRIVDFLKHYPDHPLDAVTEETFIKPTFAENVPEGDTFYVKFMNEINADCPDGISDDIFTLKIATNHLDIPSLANLIALFMTCQLEKCTTREEVMSMLRIPPFKNEEEEEMYRTECHWMFRNPTSSSL
jgi:hypothetical protein